MNEVLHIYQKNRVSLNHVITRLDLKNEKSITLKEGLNGLSNILGK